MRLTHVLLILFVASSTHAADISTPSESTHRLAQLTLMFQNEDGTPQACPERSTFGVELKREYIKRPADFGGISPQSAYWQEVEELNFQQRLASCEGTKRLADKWAELLGREVAPADVDAAVAFHMSPAGQRYRTSLAKASKEFFAFSQRPSAQQEAADAAYRKGLRALTARYLADPK